MANRHHLPAGIRRAPASQRRPRHIPDSNFPESRPQRGDYKNQNEERYFGPQHSGSQPYGSQWQHGNYHDTRIGPQQYQDRQYQRQFEDDQDYDPYRPQDRHENYRQENHRPQPHYPLHPNDRRYSSGYRENNDPYRQDYYREQQSPEDRNWWDRARDEVSSWFGDEEAQSRRSQDMHNQNGSYKGFGPKGYQRSDERIRDDINDRLSDDPYVDASDIEVLVEKGEVTLSGTVIRKDLKRRAEDIAESVSAVKNVENRIRISPFSREAEAEASGQYNHKAGSNDREQPGMPRKG